MYYKSLKIGKVKLENNILLAPMAGITDKAFRTVCKEIGNPGLICTEMVSGKAIFYGDEKTRKIYNTDEEKRPVAIQIFGSDAKIMGEAAKKIENFADIIDINMGCPAPKVIKNGDGSKLLLDLQKINDIVEEVVKSTTKPITVKLRKGWDNENIIAVEAAKIIEKAGASAIAVHGRSREQYYSGQVDLDIIKKVKENVNIPVIGNGDIKDLKSAIKMFEYTNVDAIMIGRATMGNPWILKNIINGLQGKSIDEITNEEKLRIMLYHLELCIREKGEYIGIREMRKHLCWYIKNLKDSSRLRDEINSIEDRESLEKKLKEYFKNLWII